MIIQSTKRKITLGQDIFLHKGGEGSVYAKGDTAFKVYDDPARMISTAKIGELSVLTDPRIIKPIDIILDDTGKKRVGYTMRYIPDAFILCQLFPIPFKKQNNVTLDVVSRLTTSLKDLVDHVHSKDILVVDMNEFNVLVSKNFSDPYLIDVDSFQTKSFPATALMESIRDRHAKPQQFNTGTDWFAFAIVTFQMWTGIHPYKGTHSKLRTIDERMKKNLSVFDPSVVYPKGAVTSFSLIPNSYREWYRSVFDQGVRGGPPGSLTAGATVSAPPSTMAPTSAAQQKISHIPSTAFDVTVVAEYDEPITSIWCSSSTRVVVTESGIYVNGKSAGRCNSSTVVGFTKANNLPVAARVENKKLKLMNVQRRRLLDYDCRAFAVTQYDGRIYVHSGSEVQELRLSEVGDSILVSPQIVAHTSVLTTHLYPGVVIQNLLGRWYANFFPTSGASHQYELGELQKYQIIDAKYDNRVLMLIGADKRAGVYDRFMYRFKSDFSDYDVRKKPDIVNAGINFTVTPAGVCVMINEEGQIEVFRNIPRDTNILVIDEPDNTIPRTLYHEGANVMFWSGKQSFCMKKRP